MKLWSGRFQKSTDKKVDDFNSSIRFDSRMYRQDIEGSIAHAGMLGKQEIIPKEDSAKIAAALKEILADIETGKLEFDPTAEDIHMFVETVLTERIGDAGKRLHTARSRNDQVALDIRFYLRDEILEISEMLVTLIEDIKNIAKDNLDTVMPGYTHMQKAQPITLAHHMMAYAEMFKRDVQRLFDAKKRVNIMPLGSGALATTTYPIDRYAVAKELGFDDITANSLDGVSDRDFVIETASALSLVMMHLSRFSEEIIIWNTNEFSFVEMDDAFSTGSSIMPQKKNPDVAELIRGKTGRVYGNLMALLTVMKGLPLAYNKDMQEDKEAIFDSIDTVKLCIPVFCGMINTMKVNKAAMAEGAKGGFTNATDVADYLVTKGMPFRNAHEVSGKIVFYCISKDKAIVDMSMDEFGQFSDLFGNDIYDVITAEACANNRKVPGGPAAEAVKVHIAATEKFIDETRGGEKK
ncbi:MAG: argininosuccinate lyase [Clostridia bacterium]|nr:argininosuccinate lyase [Clostridia bacterium]